MCRIFRHAAILLTINLVIFFFSVDATAAHAQQSGPATTTSVSAPATRLRVTTRLVQVNAVVNDKHGKPITGLTKDDFELLDNKKHQEIRVFADETASPPAANYAPLPADTYSNRI